MSWQARKYRQQKPGMGYNPQTGGLHDLLSVTLPPYSLHSLSTQYYQLFWFHSVALTSTMIKSNSGRKDVFGFHFQITVHHRGKSREELKQELEWEIMEECCFLTYRLMLFYIGKGHQPRELCHPQCHPQILTSIKTILLMPLGKSNLVNPSVSPQVCQVDC